MKKKKILIMTTLLALMVLCIAVIAFIYPSNDFSPPGGSPYNPSPVFSHKIENGYHNITIIWATKPIYTDKIGWGIIDENNSFEVMTTLPEEVEEPGEIVCENYSLIWFDNDNDDQISATDYFHLYSDSDVTNKRFCLYFFDRKIIINAIGLQ